MSKYEKKDLIFTPYITLKNGQRLYARQFGKKAFCFPRKEIRDKENK